MIYIIDFDAGNLKSAESAFEKAAGRLGERVQVITNPSQIVEVPSGFVLPGDGSFPFAARFLKASGFFDLLKKTDRPVMGICVGFQLLFNFSKEHGGAAGMALIDGSVVPFEKKDLLKTDKIPHMGWNRGVIKKRHILLDGVSAENWFYFVHSFYPENVMKEDVLLETSYGKPFASAVVRDNICGFQFHPEKSHREGIKIINNFVKWCIDAR